MLETGRPSTRAGASGLLLALALGTGAILACQTPVGEPRSAVTHAAAAPPAPAPTPEAPGPGRRPSAPLPRGSVVALSHIRVEVRDVERGAAGEASAPAEGRELLRVRLNLTGVGGRSWVGCGDFRVTGSDRNVYFHSGRMLPEHSLDTQDLEPGQSVEGWCVYSIPATESSLILMVDEPDSRDPVGLRYLALEEGASVADPAAATEIPEDRTGLSAQAPAPLGGEVVTHDWSVKALEILRGDDAQALVERANRTNAPPADGQEFVAVKLRARYFGREGVPGLLSVSEFKTQSADGRAYETPIVLDLMPGLPRTLLPGGEYTGWAVFLVGREDARAVLRFRPYYPDDGQRYLALAAD